MAKAAATPKAPADPVQARRAIVDRVLDRRPDPRVRHYSNVDGKGHDLTVTDPQIDDRKPPKDLAEWADDRVLATFGGRTRLTAPQQAAFDILEAARSGDPATVRQAVQAAGRGMEDWQKNLIFGVLGEWRTKAADFAYAVTVAAIDEAHRLRWDERPRRGRRDRPRAADPVMA